MEDLDLTQWVLIIGIPLGIAVGFFLFWRSRKSKVEVVHHFRCPSCKRKLKYFARQVGHKGMCGSCREHFVFPTPLSTSR